MDQSFVIKATALTYSYSREIKAVNNIDLNVRQGQIYGFLGPNGSGKTTTLRLLLGLLTAQQGSIQIFGQDVRANRIPILKKIGSLIESPSLYGHLSARENLAVYRRIYGVSNERVDTVLRAVEMEKTDRKPFKQFSLGMKQRLALALALLAQPELLILDEPTNGLDPSGIIELRALIKRLNHEKGITILISSHILSEVEKMVSHVGIIGQGKMVFEGSIGELHSLQQHSARLIVDTSDNEAALRLLQAFRPEKAGDRLTLVVSDSQQVAEVGRTLMQNDLDLYLLQPNTTDLEGLFMDLTTNRA